MDAFPAQSSQVIRNSVIAIIALSVLVGVSLAWNIKNLHEQTIRLATQEAESNWKKDQVFRRWATRHGGLYVKPDKRTPPNPYMAHLPDRDLRTEDGQELTLMNPAYMMRQMTDEYEEMYGVKGSITAKVLLNPVNKADEWELEALESFVRGARKVVAETSIDGAPFIRLMRPMKMAKGCVKCHGHLGFKVGDIRGGVSVSIPLEPYFAASEPSRQAMVASHGSVWLGGLLVIGLFGRVSRRHERERLLAQTALLDAHDKLEQRVEERTQELEAEIAERKAVHEALDQSEKLLQSIINAAPFEINLKDLDGRILIANDRARALLDSTDGDVIGKRTSELIPQEIAGPFLAIESEVKETKKTVRRVVTVPLAGTTRHFVCTKFPIKDENGRLDSIGNITSEVTDQIEAEIAVKRQAQVIENISEGVVVADNDGTIIDWNKGAEDLFGYTTEEVLGRSARILHADDIPGTTQAAILDGIEKSGAWSDEVECFRKDGIRIVVESWVTTFNDENGVPVGRVGVNRDITERKKFEAELQQHRTRLEELVVERTAELTEREQHLRLLANSLPAAITYTDSNNRFQFVNRTFSKWLNLDPDEVIGRRRQDVLPEELIETTQEAFDAAVAGRETVMESERNLGTVGHQHVQITLVPDKAEDDSIRGVFSLANDITQIRNAERAIRTSETRLAGILRIAPEAIISVDQDRCIRMFNQGAENIFGYSANEIIGRPLDVLVPGGVGERLIQLVEDFNTDIAHEHQTSERSTIQGKRKSGDEFPAAASISKLEIEGTPLFTIILRDITEQQKAKNELIKAKNQAEAGNRAKSEFLAMVSHELRTPLNAIIGFSEILGKGIGGKLNTAQAEYISAVHESGTHLLALINDILDLSKLEAGKVEMEETRVFAPLVIDQMIHLVRERAVEGSVTLRESVPDDIPMLLTDERMFKQMVLNLLSNAVKFTPEGGEVLVSAEVVQDGGMSISISDTGIGMTHENIPKALSKFGQIDSALDRQHEGTGLGLPLVESQIELHGGKLIIESEPKVGTKCSLYFPRERVIERVSVDLN